MNAQAVILAAGQGTRMKSQLPKVLHRVAGKAMVDHVVDAVRGAGVERITVVVGYELEQLRRHFAEANDLVLVQQTPQLGTGHAVQQAAERIAGGPPAVVVVYGDAPLLEAQTVAALLDRHRQANAQLTLLTATVPEPGRLGRILIENRRPVIREFAEASEEERAITEVNPGVYCFDREWLLQELPRLSRSPGGEYYLTELAGRADRLQAVHSDDIRSAVEIGVDTRQALADAERGMQERLRLYWMESGVTFIDPGSVFLDTTSRFGADCTVYPNSIIELSTIGANCVIGPSTRLHDSLVGDGCVIRESVLESAVVENGVEIGPFSHLRPGSHV
ncbi:MAG: bifunctional N-acetylglucosamine-1-phosphate uridyltransferase/glucosamine-1-phosphate acetyltransferase, partial [Chloroflexi bacterium]|nr:bifunctional N-acetylglucosamine-1-phosphate uridyltransferase/glucosamine-1-phosphate acetyltransferase [Chloroflexota bacterium]